MNWTLIKLLAAHIFADYGMQTTHMARTKNRSATSRLCHVAIVAATLLAALLTSNTTPRQVGTIIAINTCTHFAIDSFTLPKWLDQLLHIASTLISFRLRGAA